MRFGFRGVVARLAITFGAASLAGGAIGGTLDTIKERGALICGVSQGIAGFSIADDKGTWSGFDVDFCRAVAAATLGDASKVRYVPLSAADRFDALKSKQVDLLSRNSTWTMGREADLGLLFAGVNYYDGQGFLTPKSLHVDGAMELNNSKVCVQTGTTSVPNAVDFFTANHVNVETVELKTIDDVEQTYKSGGCNVLTTDVSQLYAIRTTMPKPDDHVILPDVISKEPLGPVVRQDDVTWFNIVKWVNFALIDAEELGVGAASVADALVSKKPEIMRLVGAEGDFGKQLGLSPTWALDAIKASGNYGEIYERNVGTKSKLGIPRGLNGLWNTGGILYAPPIR